MALSEGCQKRIVSMILTSPVACWVTYDDVVLIANRAG